MDNKIDIFKSNGGIEIQVKLKNNTIWLDAHLIAKLLMYKDQRLLNMLGTSINHKS
jgi:hypothetical protein